MPSEAHRGILLGTGSRRAATPSLDLPALTPRWDWIGPRSGESFLSRARPATTDSGRAVEWIWAVFLISIVTSVSAALIPALRHWFIVPTSLCGILLAPDAVAWARRRLDVFDPQAVLGLVGTYFFYVCPLLHVGLDYWAKFLDGPPDWRAALGRMALINVLGILVYRAVMAPRLKPIDVPQPTTDLRRYRKLTLAGAVVGAASFGALVMHMGGPSAYADVMANDRQQLAGLGPVLLLSSVFPTAALVLALVTGRKFFRRRPSALVILIFPYVLLEFFVDGLGGSRSHTIWSIAIAIGTCHFLIKPIRRRVLGILGIVLIVFMYFYGFYKDHGTEAFQVFTGETTFAQLSSQSGRDLPSVFLEDLGRADIQALILEHEREGTAPLQYGRTYIGDLAFLVPGHAVLWRFPNKVQAGTDMLYGQGSYSPAFSASQIYGLAGEGVLNFGPPGAVLAFVPLAMVARWGARFYRRCLVSPGAPGIAALAPAISLGIALVLTSDLDNTVWYFVNYVSFLAVIALVSRLDGRRSTRHALDAGGRRLRHVLATEPASNRRSCGSAR